MKMLMVWLALFGPLQSADDALQAAVQHMRTPVLEQPMHQLTGIGKPVVVFGALLLVAAFDAAAGPATARLALAVLVPTNLIVEGLKRGVGRVRPDGDAKRSNSSFPSSHAANAFALAWVLSRRYRRFAPAFMVFAALVAFSRVYLNRHYVSDVVAGAAIGLLCAYGTARWLAARAREREGTAKSP